MNTKDLERFWSKVDLFFGITDEDCWNWKAGTSDGYGWMGFRRGNKRAHYLVFNHYKQTGYDRKLQVMHTCNNRLCVNPSHLVLGTNKDNQMHATRCGRSRGQKRPLLSNKEIEEIKQKKQQKIKMRELAKEYNVSTPTLYDAIRGKGAYS